MRGLAKPLETLALLAALPILEVTEQMATVARRLPNVLAQARTL
jgi:hypothetical protein